MDGDGSRIKIGFGGYHHVNAKEHHRDYEPNSQTHYTKIASTPISPTQPIPNSPLILEGFLQLPHRLLSIALGHSKVILNLMQCLTLLLHYLIQRLVHLVDF